MRLFPLRLPAFFEDPLVLGKLGLTKALEDGREVLVVRDVLLPNAAGLPEGGRRQILGAVPDPDRSVHQLVHVDELPASRERTRRLEAS